MFWSVASQQTDDIIEGAAGGKSDISVQAEIFPGQEVKIRELERCEMGPSHSIDRCTKKITETSSTQTIFTSSDASVITTAAQDLNVPLYSVGITTERERPAFGTPAQINELPLGSAYKKLPRGRILILGRGVASLLYRSTGLHDDYCIESIYKPGTTYGQVIEDIGALTSDYTGDDYIVVIGGSNSFTRTTRYPLFKDISNSIKKCLSSNVTLVTIPYKKTLARIALYINLTLSCHPLLIESMGTYLII